MVFLYSNSGFPKEIYIHTTCSMVLLFVLEIYHIYNLKSRHFIQHMTI